ncbi:ABC transporter substrate-binding protein [Desulfurivibrio sp. D14AmB]|uniref:ABC transporter substrate-binding protein n=1 Tax=Desulfurivibrio sp. D14AmB TaxID=3374370 RepID=UPI00376F0883
MGKCRIWPSFFFVLLLLLSPLSLAGAAPEEAVSGESAHPLRVVFIRYPIEPGHFASVVNRFKAGMTARGYREGYEIEYLDILTRSSDLSAVPDVVAAVNRYLDSADLFVTCGWVSLHAREILRDTGVPQLFVPVLHSVALEMLPSVTAPPETNLSGLYLMYHPEKILRLTRLLLPASRNYAYIYDSRIPADLVYKKAYQQISPAEHHGLNLVYLDLAAGVEPVIAALREQEIDAFGGIVGVFQHRLELAVSGIPVITSYTLDIDRETLGRYMAEDNIVAGLFNPFEYGGAQAAEMAADIFDGITSIGEIQPRRSMQLAFINLKNAERLQLAIPFAALEAVDFVLR